MENYIRTQLDVYLVSTLFYFCTLTKSGSSRLEVSHITVSLAAKWRQGLKNSLLWSRTHTHTKREKEMKYISNVVLLKETCRPLHFTLSTCSGSDLPKVLAKRDKHDGRHGETCFDCSTFSVVLLIKGWARIRKWFIKYLFATNNYTEQGLNSKNIFVVFFSDVQGGTHHSTQRLVHPGSSTSYKLLLGETGATRAKSGSTHLLEVRDNSVSLYLMHKNAIAFILFCPIKTLLGHSGKEGIFNK